MSTIITRAGKGSPLTNDEVDANFNNLNSTKVETSAVGTIATQAANSVAITGGTINGTTVGSTTAAAGSFTTLTTSGQVNFNSTSLAGPSIVFAANSTQTSGYMEYAVTDGTRFAELGLVKTFSSSYGLANEAFVRASGSTAGLSINSASINPIRFSVGASGSSAEQFRISNTASAVNYAQATGAATGAAPTISAQGSDANINLNLSPKGTGAVVASGSFGFSTLAGISIGSSGNYIYQSSASTLQFKVGTTPAYFGFVDNGGAMGVTSGNAILFTGTGGTTFRIANSIASSVNYVQVDSATTTNAPALSAQGSDTNINLKLTPKGTGVLQFGTYTAGALSPTGYITITDAGGTSRRLLVG